MKRKFTATANKDLSQALNYLIKHSAPGAAAQLLNNVDRALKDIAAGLITGPEVQLRSGRLARAWSIPPYKLYYTIESNTIVVFRVYHQSRRPIER